ncbi:MAG TPA: phosphate acyltransferase [Eubacteriales bacterium]|nr:phosphate acyltransferase [Eubacteriales bacterium]
MKGSFEKILKLAQEAETLTIAVAVAQDPDVLRALRSAADLKLVHPLLIGDEAEIKRVARDNAIDVTGFPIIDEPDKVACCNRAVTLTSQGKAHVVMKGIVDTSSVLRAALNKDYGLRDAPLLNHVGIFELDNVDRLLFMSDGAMNLLPNVDQKQAIIENTQRVTKVFGVENPIAACICAMEKVNPKMQCTLDAVELVKRNEEGKLTGCRVVGPLGLDNAVFTDAAVHKGIMNPLAGRADILLMPNIEAGNILYKTLIFISGARSASALVGAKAPLVITSRADADDVKLNSIALAMVMAGRKLKE